MSFNLVSLDLKFVCLVTTLRKDNYVQKTNHKFITHLGSDLIEFIFELYNFKNY